MKIYSKDNCTFCDQAKMLLQMKFIKFEEIKIGIEITREEFLETFPEVKTLPLIFDGDVKIGGFQELKRYLENNVR